MTNQLTREIIPRCLTQNPEECPGEYDASAIGKILICALHGEKAGVLA